jgi:hypothetical protein
MKLKALLLACAVAGAGASFALADDGHGKHHESSTTGSTSTSTTGTTTTTPTPDCQRVELRGKLASVSATSFTLDVTKANDAGKALVGHTSTIAVVATTRVEWSGTGTLTGPNAGDNAKVKACSTGTTLTAKSVRASGPNAGEND